MANKKKVGQPEKELEVRWWWRRLEFCSFSLVNYTTCRQKPEKQAVKSEWDRWTLFLTWRDSIEIAARRYELVRRLRPESKLPSWIELSNHAQRSLNKAIGKELFTSNFKIIQPPKVLSGYWSNVPATESHHYNLQASDSRLCKLFLMWIDEQRKMHGFAVPKSKSGKRGSYKVGNRNRKVSWRWPELMDIHRLGSRSLENKERRLKCDAELEAAAWAESAEGALKALQRPLLRSAPPPS